MDKNEHSMAPADEQDAQTDPLSPLIAAALADHVLPPLPDDLDAESAAQVLTAEDQQALARLGSSQDLIRRLKASAAAGEPSQQNTRCEETTQVSDLDATIPLPGSPFWAGGGSPDFDDLMKRLEAVQQAGEVHWTSRYRKLQERGRGGQGIVYLTECLDELGGEQALKIYSTRPYENSAAYREDMQRLQSVASLVHRIHHDNVVDVQQFVDYHGIYVMVMQWIDGFDLRRLLEPELLANLRGRIMSDRWQFLNKVIYATRASDRLCLQPLVAVNIVEKCLRGLSALHENGIVHGDIKPSNIMLDSNGSIRLIDIGSACPFKQPPRQRIWTPRYAPPEFLERGEWTPKSDLASLGYVLIELLCGTPDGAAVPIGDESTRTGNPHRDQVLLEAKRCLPQRLPDLLPEKVRCDKLVRLCSKLIDPDPAKRFDDATQAISSEHRDGTWHFRMELVRGDLAIYEASEIKFWVNDVKKLFS